ncbi:hypothetical protein GLOIN_2v1672276 [Rhizophagus irregularis DAOM 181602=DAOM 197198]|nr:hypothetical protein GLOIN_2v1672276 [Rhizophagus irregularis DAOM 181602=DAOM 197198]
MSLEYFQDLSNDLEKLLTTEKGYDVIIYVGENENIKEFHAHSNILCTRSQYFCTAFSNKKDGKFIFEKSNISPQIFKIILRFIYCGKIDLTKLLGPEVLDLLMALDELNFNSLIPHVQKYLINHQDKFLKQNPIEILETRDDLVLDEIEIWNNLLKWGIAKNPSISLDITKWSNEDITIIERSLHGFIPLIRFYHISSDDFLDKIYPLKELLPKDLADDLVKFNIARNRKPNIDEIQPPRSIKPIYDSILIRNRHFAVFASWINKKENLHYNNVRNIPYKFNLLYRASRDDKNNYETAKVSYSNGNEYSIRNYSGYGPMFGGGNDLIYSSDGMWYCNRGIYSSYHKIDGMPTGGFNVNDYEVFQVIEK